MRTAHGVECNEAHVCPLITLWAYVCPSIRLVYRYAWRDKGHTYSTCMNKARALSTAVPGALLMPSWASSRGAPARPRARGGQNQHAAFVRPMHRSL